MRCYSYSYLSPFSQLYAGQRQPQAHLQGPLSALLLAASAPSAGKQRIASRTKPSTLKVDVVHPHDSHQFVQCQQQQRQVQCNAGHLDQKAKGFPAAGLNCEDEAAAPLLLNQWQYKHEVRKT
jgi:hypothetical protein